MHFFWDKSPFGKMGIALLRKWVRVGFAAISPSTAKPPAGSGKR
jgi:hypothetical protein